MKQPTKAHHVSQGKKTVKKPLNDSVVTFSLLILLLVLSVTIGVLGNVWWGKMHREASPDVPLEVINTQQQIPNI